MSSLASWRPTWWRIFGGRVGGLLYTLTLTDMAGGQQSQLHAAARPAPRPTCTPTPEKRFVRSSRPGSQALVTSRGARGFEGPVDVIALLGQRTAGARWPPD